MLKEITKLQDNETELKEQTEKPKKKQAPINNYCCCSSPNICYSSSLLFLV